MNFPVRPRSCAPGHLTGVPRRRLPVEYTAALTAIVLLLGVLLFGAARPAQAQQLRDESVWWEVQDGEAKIHLYFFWWTKCPHCLKAHPFIEQLPQRYPWLELHALEVTERPENGELYARLAQGLGEEAGPVPAFFYCGTMFTGYGEDSTTGTALARNLELCHEWVVANRLPSPALPAAAAGETGVEAAPTAASEKAAEAMSGVAATAPENAGAAESQAGAAGAPPVAAAEGAATIMVPLVGEVALANLSLPAQTLLIAGVDAFNPCAFFVLLFLLGLLVHAQSRRRMLLIGGLFVLFSGLIYFVFMAAWLNLFLFLGELALITTLAGLLAVVIGGINVKDFFWFKQGVSLSIPDRAKPGLYRRTRELVRASSLPAMVASTVVLALVTNSYELLCTMGFPMVYTKILTGNDLAPAAYYAWLALYNLVYVLPLLVIVVLFTVGLGAHKLTEREGRVLKLLSGLMMLFLGILLIAAPQLLNQVATAFLLLAAALVVTVVFTLLDRRYWHPNDGAQPARRG